MATYTWDSLQAPYDWTDSADWGVNGVFPNGPPVAGDTAIVGGTISLEQSLHNITVLMPVSTDTSEIVATNVDLGDNFDLVVTNPNSNAGFVVYKVIGTGTLDGSNPTAGVQPELGIINAIAHQITFDLAAGAQFINNGSMFGAGLQILADNTAASAVFVNNTSIDLTGVFVLGAGTTLTGSGVVNIFATSNANFDISGAVTAGQTLDFTGSPTSLHTLYGGVTIADISTFQGTIVLTQANNITLTNVASTIQSYTNNLVRFANGDTLHVALSGLAQSLSTVIVGGATEVFANVACFAAGTRVATPEGERPVETLAAGDTVRLARGGVGVVRWVGHRHVDCRRHPRPHDVLPVRVRAGAFGANRPARDLKLSPDHAVFSGGVLIPVRYLLNGASIAQEAADSVTYWHVELDRHEVILAENLPCESYLDTGNRMAFAHAGAVALHPDFSPGRWDADSRAPLVLDGPHIAATRARLLRRAAALGARRTADPGICFMADGLPVRAVAERGGWAVTLPAGTKTLRLRSRIWVPAHMSPEESDTRALGVAIGRLWLDGREVSLDSPGLAAGWHAPEPVGRWTDGDARIDVSGAKTLRVVVAMTGQYWREAAREPLALAG